MNRMEYFLWDRCKKNLVGLLSVLFPLLATAQTVYTDETTGLQYTLHLETDAVSASISFNNYVNGGISTVDDVLNFDGIVGATIVSQGTAGNNVDIPATVGGDPKIDIWTFNILCVGALMPNYNYDPVFLNLWNQVSVKAQIQVTNIADRAFYNNANIASLNLSNATNLQRIGFEAFRISGLKGTVSIPNWLESVGTSCFLETEIENVILPAANVDIEKYAFQNCYKIKSITIPEGFEVMNQGLFAGSLVVGTKITFPSTLRYIGRAVFEGTGLTSPVVLPAGLTHLGVSAFSNSVGISGDFVVPAGVKDVYGYVFYNTNVRTVTYKSTTLNLNSIDQELLDVVGGDLTHMQNFGTFKYCDNLEYVDMSAATLINGTAPTSFNRTVADNIFTDMPAHTVVYLPKDDSGTFVELVDKLQATNNHENFVLSDGVGKMTCDWLYIQDGCDYHMIHGFTAEKATWNVSSTTFDTTPNAVRTVTGTVTAYLPFEFKLEYTSKLRGYRFKAKNNVSNVHEFIFEQQTKAYQYMANTPYIIRSMGGENEFVTMEKVNVPQTPVSHIKGVDSDGKVIYGTSYNAMANSLATNGIADDLGGTWGFYGTTEMIDNTTASNWKAFSYQANDKSWHPVTLDGIGFISPMRTFIASKDGAVPAKGFTMTMLDIDGTATNINSINNEEIISNSVEIRIYTVSGQYVGEDLNSLPKGMYIVNGKKMVK